MGLAPGITAIRPHLQIDPEFAVGCELRACPKHGRRAEPQLSIRSRGENLLVIKDLLASFRNFISRAELLADNTVPDCL